MAGKDISKEVEMSSILKKCIRAMTDSDYRFLVLRKFGFFNGMSDEKYLPIFYHAITGEKLDLMNPRSFNEKIQWLKLYDRKSIYTDMVDKERVKHHVARVLGEQYVIPTLGIWKHFDEIDFDRLPNQFVLKCTHDSGGIAICKDKQTFDYNKAKKKIEASLGVNYYLSGREWPYKNVEPRIIAEKFMADDSGEDINDYKFFVFSGKVYCIQVDYDRFIDHHRNFYDTEWNYLPFTTCYPTDSKHIIEKPGCLDELISCAERLSESIGNPRHVRIDMYVINNKPYFGEITFYHGSGCEKFIPEEWGKRLGDLIEI